MHSSDYETDSRDDIISRKKLRLRVSTNDDLIENFPEDDFY